MALKVLILLGLATLGKTQEIIEPDLRFNERFRNLGSSSIHSVKGKFYEEKQRKINNSIPNIHNDNVSKLNSELKMTPSQDTLPNISNPELTRQNEKILFRRNKEYKQSLNDIGKPMETVNNSNGFTFNVKDDSSKKLQSTQENSSDSTVFGLVRQIHDLSLKGSPSTQFLAENVIASYDKNNTIETIKKELAFDSLLIKNNFNNMSMPHEPTNNMNSYMSHEITPERGIIDDPVTLRMDEPNRRLLAPNAYDEPSDPFQIPIGNENNIIPHIPNFEPPKLDINPRYNLPNFMNPDSTVPLGQNNYNHDVIDKNMSCDDKESDESLDRSGNILLQDPTKGLGISNVGKSRIMLMDHPRVCYACSSINDLSCWSPDRRTAVKYCRTDHLSCLTKLYKYKGLSYIIRDCGNTCVQKASAGGPTKYTSCTICQHDLCNSAHHFKNLNVTIFLFFIIIFYVLNMSVN